MATPPFAIAETLPQPSDLISQYPPVEQTFRDIVESWLTLISDPATGFLRQISVDSGATAGPTFTLYRDSPSPAVSDLIGQLVFQGKDSAGNTENYVTFTGRIDNATSGSEASSLLIDLLGVGEVQISSTDAGAGAGPNLFLYRNSVSPAASDVIGLLGFRGEDSAGNNQLYGYITAAIVDPTSGSEDSRLSINTIIGGVDTQSLDVRGALIGIGGASGSNASIHRAGLDNGAIILSSGSAFNSGANVELYGPSHASFANQMFFDSSRLTIRDQTGGVTRALIDEQGDIYSFGSSGFATSAGAYARQTPGTLFFRPNGISSGSGQATIDSSGNFTAAGNVTAFSDDRLKEHWADLDQGFLSQLIEIKSGTYTRKDLHTRQTGVSAQDLREVLPQAVHETEDGTLSVAYGQAALVAVIELAREVDRLKRELNL